MRLPPPPPDGKMSIGCLGDSPAPDDLTPTSRTDDSWHTSGRQGRAAWLAFGLPLREPCRSPTGIHMRNFMLATMVIVGVFSYASLSRLSGSDDMPHDSTANRVYIGQSIEDAKRIFAKQGIEPSERVFAFPKVDPDLEHLIVIIDKNHTSACVHYSKAQSKVTRLQMIFFSSRRQPSKSSESWLSATELQLNDDRTYSVTFSPPLTDDEIRTAEENSPPPQLPPFGK